MLRADEPIPRDPCPSLPRHVIDLVAATGLRLRAVATVEGASKAGAPPPPASETLPPSRRRRGLARIVVAEGWGDATGALSGRRPLR